MSFHSIDGTNNDTNLYTILVQILLRMNNSPQSDFSISGRLAFSPLTESTYENTFLDTEISDGELETTTYIDNHLNISIRNARLTNTKNTTPRVG